MLHKRSIFRLPGLLLLTAPLGAQIHADVDADVVRRAVAAAAARLPAIEEAWANGLEDGDDKGRSFAALFGYAPPGTALTLAFLAGFLYEQSSNPADALAAASWLERYAGYRDAFPAELARERVEYATGLPASPSFFHLPDFAQTWMRIRSCEALPAEQRELITEALAGSADFVFVFPEWGAHNRAMLRALGLTACAQALPDHPRAPAWTKMAAVLADDSASAWEIEDAQHYHPIWLHALLRHARLTGDDRVFESVQVRAYLRMFLALLAPNGIVPDFGDGWWRSSLHDYYACLARGAAGTGDPELSWAAERVYAALPAFDPERPDLGRAMLYARLAHLTGKLPEPREPDPARTRVDDVVGKKIVLRTGFAEDDLYFLVNYRDEGDWGRVQRDYLRQTLAVEHEKMHHGHEDEGSIVLFMDAGSVLLHDAGYRDQVPSGPNGAWRADVFHNRLVVRGGAVEEPDDLRTLLLDDGTYQPARTERIDFLHFELGSYARTRVTAADPGYIWDRTLFLASEPRVVIVVDSVLVTDSGEYTFADLFATGEIVDSGPGYAIGRTTHIGAREVPHTRDLLMEFLDLEEPPGSFVLSRHARDERVFHRAVSGTFAAGERLAFVTLLWPIEPGTDPGARPWRARLVPTSAGEAAVALEIASAATRLSLVVKTDLAHGVGGPETRPRYSPEAGRITAGDLTSDADILVVRRTGAEARWSAANMTQVKIGEHDAFEARPFQVFQTTGRSDVVGRAKWRMWEDTLWLDLRARLVRAAGVLTIASLLGCSRGTQSAPVPDPLMGTWDAIEGNAFGVPVTGGALGLTLTFTPEKVVWTFQTPDGVRIHDGAYRHDATRVPMEIDLAQPEGEEPLTFLLGIYSLDEDRLKTRMGVTRPRSFSEEALMSLVLERSAPER